MSNELDGKTGPFIIHTVFLTVFTRCSLLIAFHLPL